MACGSVDGSAASAKDSTVAPEAALEAKDAALAALAQGDENKDTFAGTIMAPAEQSAGAFAPSRR